MMEQLKLFGHQVAEDQEATEWIKNVSIEITIDELQVGDRLFYGTQYRKHYGRVTQVIEAGKFFKVEDLGVSKTIGRDNIIPNSCHRWVKQSEVNNAKADTGTNTKK